LHQLPTVEQLSGFYCFVCHELGRELVSLLTLKSSALLGRLFKTIILKPPPTRNPVKSVLKPEHYEWFRRQGQQTVRECSLLLRYYSWTLGFPSTQSAEIPVVIFFMGKLKEAKKRSTVLLYRHI
jgi:hypothetical protein